MNPNWWKYIQRNNYRIAVRSKHPQVGGIPPPDMNGVIPASSHIPRSNAGNKPNYISAFSPDIAEEQ